MKINEESINHNTVRLIKKEIDELYSIDANDLSSEFMVAQCQITIGNIYGIVKMAETMKEVLNA